MGETEKTGLDGNRKEKRQDTETERHNWRMGETEKTGLDGNREGEDKTLRQRRDRLFKENGRN